MSKAPPHKNDAVDLLDADHIAVKKLFTEFKKLHEGGASAKKRKALADEICRQLTAHTRIEEEIFYPALRGAATQELEDLLDEAEVEHSGAKELIAQLEGMDGDDGLFDAKVTVLGEYIDHHVKEEREDMFPKARQTGVDLVAMVPVLKERKEELLAGLAAA